MMMWHSVKNLLPGDDKVLEVGDRVLLLLKEINPESRKVDPRIITLVVEEFGWSSPDPDYSGYWPEVGEYWAYEKDVICDIELTSGATNV